MPASHLEGQPNINAVWAALMIESLVRHGVRHLVLCPGSRSAPLAVAAARNPRMDVRIRIDERGAAYHALGLGRVGRTAAVITTSGTAVANLVPAALEAATDGVPLVLLTADRPAELRACAANQSVRQHDLLEGTARFVRDLPEPTDRIPARFVLTTMAEAMRQAHGPHPGPVHINCPFREPLAPTEEAWDRSVLAGLSRWLVGSEPFTQGEGVCEAMHPLVGRRALEAIEAANEGLVVAAGPLDPETAKEVAGLAAHLGWPLIPDVRSQLRLSEQAWPWLDLVLESGVADWQPQVVLCLGARPVSKPLQAWWARSPLDASIVVAPGAERVDPSHDCTHRVVSSVAAFATAARSVLRKRKAMPRAFEAAHRRIEATLGEILDDTSDLSEVGTARALLGELGDDDALVLSNSLPIRLVQEYAGRQAETPWIVANRGASGIDGLVSTAAGVAEGTERRTTLLIGDLALLHDLGSLGCLKWIEQPITLVVLNNGGGGIFGRLPIARHGDVLSPYFDTPHDLDFEGAARMFGLSYHVPHTPAQFLDAFRGVRERRERAIIEVRVTKESTHHLLAALDERIGEAIRAP